MRHESKSTVITLCADMLLHGQSNLVVVSSMFNKLNRIYHYHMEALEAQRHSVAALVRIS